MPIYHLSVRRVSRARGMSTVGAAAYRSASLLVDQRTGVTHDYRRRSGVRFSKLIIPTGGPQWSRSELWNQLERAETRINACPARDCVVALPDELPFEDHVVVGEQMGEWISARHRCAVDFALHEPVSRKDRRNKHIHYLCSTRRLREYGFAEKARELDAQDTGPDEIRAWRKQWECFVNAALRARSIDARVDHRSHQARGLVELPTIKVGRGPGSPDRKKRNEEIRKLNDELRMLRDLCSEQHEQGCDDLAGPPSQIGDALELEVDDPEYPSPNARVTPRN